MEMTRSQAARETLRAQLIAKIVVSGYRPMLHLLIPSLFGLCTALGSLTLLKNLRLSELWTIPATYFLGLGLEWRVHKDMLHRRLPFFSELYERHERMHHVVYTADDMEMRSQKEWALVLMPWFAIVLVTAVLLPVALLSGWLLSRNCGVLVLCTGVAFFLSYEWLHLAYHLPHSHPVARIGFIRRLSAFHRCHHDPPNMKRWNFNVTIPLFDVIHGSLKRG